MEKPAKRARYNHQSVNGRADRHQTFQDLLPDDVLIHILEYSAPCPSLAARWTWLDRMRATSTTLKRLATCHFVPNKLHLDFLFHPENEHDHGVDKVDEIAYNNRVAFINSFVTQEWKSRPLESVTISATNQIAPEAIQDEQVKTALRKLLTTQGCLPNLSKIAILGIDRDMSGSDEEDFDLFHDASVLSDLATAHPNIDYLYLDGCFASDLHVTARQWGKFAQALDKLKTIIIGSAGFLNDTLIKSCAPHWKNLRFLGIDGCGVVEGGSNDQHEQGMYRLTDAALIALAKHCRHLENLALKSLGRITEVGLEALLKVNPDLIGLDIEGSIAMTLQAARVIRKFAPQLVHLKVLHSEWFTDDALLELVGHNNSDDDISPTVSSLEALNMKFTNVTPAGLRKVLEKNPKFMSSPAHLDIGYGIKDLKDATTMRPGVTYEAIADLGIEEDELEELRLGMERLKAEWLAIANEYGIVFKTRGS